MNENINIDVKVGDVILTGKFKNKKTVIKTIGKDEHGMPTINGRKACNFRIAKKEKAVKESQIRKVIKEELIKLGKEVLKESLQNTPFDIVFLKATLKKYLGPYGILDDKDYKNMYRYIIKTDPHMDSDKFLGIISRVGKESTIGTQKLSGTDAQIRNEIENYYGI